MVNLTLTDPIHKLTGNMIKLVKCKLRLNRIQLTLGTYIHIYSQFSLANSIARSSSFTPLHVASRHRIGIATLCVRLENR